MARHPLDVLISILQFCMHDDSTLQWMNGEGGDERAIQGAMPGSAVFQEYAAGPRAAALMTVSREWAAAPECIRVRYETLIADNSGELTRITEELGEPARRLISEVTEGATIPKLRDRTGAKHHFWQGREGLWRSLFIPQAVERLAAAHQAYCAELGYLCDGDPQLGESQADANWLALLWPQVTEKLRDRRRIDEALYASREEIHRIKAERAAAVRQLEELVKNNEQLIRNREELVSNNQELVTTKEALITQYEELARYNAEVVRSRIEAIKGYQELRDYCTFLEQSYQEMEAMHRYASEARRAAHERLRGLGPVSIAMARWLAGVSQRLPGASTAVKKLLHLDQSQDSMV